MTRNKRTAGALLRAACLIVAAGAAAQANSLVLPELPPPEIYPLLPLPPPLGWEFGAPGTDSMPLPPPFPPVVPEPWPAGVLWLPLLPAPPGSEPGWLLPPLTGMFLWMPPLPPPDGFMTPPLPGDSFTSFEPAMAWLPPPAEAPEPGTLLLAGTLLAGLAAYRCLPSICHSVKGERAPRTFTSMQ